MTTEHDYVLRDLQELNTVIYGIPNDRRYSLVDIISYIHDHSTRLLKSVRKNDHQYTKYYICSAFSWTLACASRMHIEVADEMWKCFPGCCPYCSGRPCICKQRGNSRSNLERKQCELVTVSEWQKMLGEIYPGNTLTDSAMHLAEEIGELSVSSRNYQRTSDEDHLAKFIEEVIDVFANLFAVSTCLKISLGDALARYFSQGLCLKCRQSPCECSYVEFDTPVEF